MAGYQFAHVEVYSAKGKPAAGPEDYHGKRKNGQRAWTAQEIIDELERLEHASRHVIAGRPGPEIHPGAVDNFRDLRDAQVAAASVKESFPYTKKDGTKTTRERKLRADAASIYASVVSLPVKSEDALADEDLKAKSLEVLNASIEHERNRIEKAGGRFMMAVTHWDEEYLHTHIIALDPKRGRVDHLHPGRAAKKLVMEESKGRKIAKKAVNKLGNDAYCQAMRAWQTDFYEAVFRDAGLLRFGPRRERLSRSEYKRVKEAASLRAEDEDRREQLEQWDADVSERSLAVRAREEQAAEQLSRAERLHAEAQQTSVASSESIEKSKAREKSAEAREKALVAGTTAVLERQIAYRPETEKMPEGLCYGPAAPKGKTERRTLAAHIQPAFEAVVAFARKFSSIEREEKDLDNMKKDLIRREAELKSREQQQEAEAARLGWRSRVLAKATKSLRDFVPKPLRHVIDAAERGEGPDLSKGPEAFPDALSVSKRPDKKIIQEKVDAMSNRGLTQFFAATQDAYLLTEDDRTLQSTFATGLKVLAFEASQRGVDLETGRHDPAKAKDPKKAKLHTDQPYEPIRVRQVVKERQLVR